MMMMMMMMFPVRSFFFVLALTALLSADARARPFLATSPHVSFNKALAKNGAFSVLNDNSNRRPLTGGGSATSAVLAVPRGGIGPLNAKMTARVYAAMVLAQGVAMNCGPSQSLDLYGLRRNKLSDDSTLSLLMSTLGCGLISYSIFLFAILWKGLNAQDASKFVIVIWMYHILRSILSGEWERANGVGSAVGAWTVMDIFIVALVGLFSAKAELVTTVSSVFWATKGLQMIVSPVTAFVSWKGDKKKYTGNGFNVSSKNLMMRCFGYGLIAQGVAAMTLLKLNATPAQATGYSCIVWFAFHLFNIIWGTWKEAGGEDLAAYTWLTIHSIMILTTLL